jgi:predicted transcriptional regulator
MQRIDRRTKHDIEIDILKTMLDAENNGIELKRTHIQHKCNVNYLVIVEYTDRLIENKLIKRNAQGIYTLTPTGREYAHQANMSERNKTEIIKIAKEMMNDTQFVEGDKMHERILELRKLFRMDVK